MLWLLLGLGCAWLYFATQQPRAQWWARWQTWWQRETHQTAAFLQWASNAPLPLPATEQTAFRAWLRQHPPAQARALRRALEDFYATADFYAAQPVRLEWVWRPQLAPHFRQALGEPGLLYLVALWRGQVQRASAPPPPAPPTDDSTATPPYAALEMWWLKRTGGHAVRQFISLTESPANAPDRQLRTETAPLGVAATLDLALRRYWRPHWALGAAFVGLLAFQQTYLTTFYFSLKFVVDLALAASAGVVLPNLLGGLVVGLGLVGLIAVGQEVVKARAAALILNDVRRQLFNQLQRLSADFYARGQDGNVVARFTSDLAEIRRGAVDGVVELAEHSLGFAAGVGALFFLEWRLALGLLAALSVGYGVLARWLAPRAAEAAYRLKRGEGQIAGLVQENVRGQAVVRAFGLQPHWQAQFNRRLQAFLGPQTEALFLTQFAGMFGGAFLLAAQVLTLSGGAWLVFQGQLTVGTLAAFTLLLTTTARNLHSILRYVVPDLIAAGSGLRRIDEVLQMQPTIIDGAAALHLPPLAQAIRLENVAFQYSPTTPPVLRDINLTLPAGQWHTVVGPSGSGKTTLLNLLTRMYDPTTGRVLFDAQDLRTATLDSLQQQIGVVAQETFLFDLSIRENLQLAKPSATHAEIEAAAQAAEIHDFIISLPEGYETPVGQAGTWLSAGQRQRLAIARALVRNPALLVLDEATSALDLQAEAAFLATLEKLAVGRTVVLVTHRLAAAARAHQVIVLEQGQVVEQGRPGDLLAQPNSRYARWWALQASWPLPNAKPLTAPKENP